MRVGEVGCKVVTSGSAWGYPNQFDINERQITVWFNVRTILRDKAKVLRRVNFEVEKDIDRSGGETAAVMCGLRMG